MEDKQLNFNQPFLSVRRSGPTPISQESDARKTDHSRPAVPRLPFYKAELKSGPITNPGTVPFLWERSPGRPKQELKSQDRSIDVVPIGPKLPPGRYRKANYQKGSDNVHPAISGSRDQVVNTPSSSDRKGKVNYVPSNENIKTVVDSRDATDEVESCDSVDDDGAYMDALDSFSRTESFSLNCSLSEMDDLDMQPYRNVETDPQNREFMMDRFLPAAKAMASETHHHAPRRQPPVEEKPLQLKQIINQNQPSLRYGPSYARQYSHYDDIEGVADEEESDDESGQHSNLPGACGLLQQFCLKGSLGRLNPVSSSSVRTRAPMFSSPKGQPSSLSGSYSSINKESTSDKTEVKPTGIIQTSELVEGKTQSRDDRCQLGSHSTSAHCSVPSSISEDRGIPGIPKEANVKGLGFHGKGSKTFQELLAEQDNSEESDPGGSVVEKTLYVDTMQRVDSPNLRSVSPNKQNRNGMKDTSSEEGLEIVDERMDQTHKINSLAEDIKLLYDRGGNEKLLLSVHTFADLIAFPSSNTCRMEKPYLSGNQDSSLDPSATRNIEQPKNKETKGFNKQLPRATTLTQSHQNHSQNPESPPLPKSPSDSWLFRTLPAKSRKNPTLRSYLGETKNHQNQGSRAPATDTKWETLVKAMKVEHRQLPHSEGLLKGIPET